MVFDGLKKIFNRIGNLTFDSTQKMGEGVQRTEDRVKKIRPKRPEISYPTRKKKKDSRLKTSTRSVKKIGAEKDEIAIFRDLVGQKYEKQERAESERMEKQQDLRKASLEELLKEEEKKGLDPRLIIVMGIVSFAVVFVVLLALGFGFEIGLVFGILILFMSMMIVYLPKIRSGGRSTAASRELPFALRQMATELKAGIGLHDSMRSVAISGYGPLSEEFARALEEIKYGETTEKALMDMSERIESDGLKRAIYQITRTLSSGGDLAKTLTVIADDTAYEMRMKLKDYAQKLNSFTMIYMFVAILGPVIFMIMMIAASTVMGPIVPPFLIIILYLFLFPMIVAFMAFMIKRLEPKL